MAFRINPDQPVIDDPLEGLFDERNWEFDLEDTYSVVDDSLDPNQDLIYWPAMDLNSLARVAEEQWDTSSAYRARRNNGLIANVPPLPSNS
jgi:hypothetical protein